MRETQTPRLIADLTEGRLDAAIVALPVSEPSLTEVALFREDFVLVRPAAEADLPVPSGEALGTMRLLLLEEGHCFRDQALAFCAMTARPREILDGSSLSTLVHMVSAGFGVTLIPDMAVPVETRSAAVARGAVRGAAALPHDRHGLAVEQPAGPAAPGHRRDRQERGAAPRRGAAASAA